MRQSDDIVAGPGLRLAIALVMGIMGGLLGGFVVFLGSERCPGEGISSYVEGSPNSASNIIDDFGVFWRTLLDGSCRGQDIPASLAPHESINRLEYR